MDRLHWEGKTGRTTSGERRRYEAVQTKLASMREGKDEFNVYQYLGAHGFLPNYAFPRKATRLAFQDQEEELVRDTHLALAELAPGNSVYYRGSRYVVQWARLPRLHDGPETVPLLVCPSCEAAYLETDASASVCRMCGNDFGVHHPVRALRLPDMLARRRARITSDEEERQRLGYVVTHHYTPDQGQKVAEYRWVRGEETIATLRFLPQARILHVNHGPRDKDNPDRGEGFFLCAACQEWLPGEGKRLDHLNPNSDRPCPRHATAEDLQERLRLYTYGHQDAVIIDVKAPLEASKWDAQEFRAFSTTLAYALLQGMQLALGLDSSELQGFTLPDPRQQDRWRILLYETAEGGIGAIRSLQQETRWKAVLGKALDLLHGNPEEDGCEKACYDCLCTYYNQQHHHLLDRRLVLPTLKEWSQSSLKFVPAVDEAQHEQDLLEQCESGYERQFLKEVRLARLPLPDQGQKTIYTRDGVPVAEADFYYETAQQPIVVFVDGSPHEEGHVAFGDAQKRRTLKNLGYGVVVYRPGEEREALERLRSLLWLEGQEMLPS